MTVVVEQRLRRPAEVHERVEVGPASGEFRVERGGVDRRVGEHEAVADGQAEPLGEVGGESAAQLGRRSREHDADHRATAGTRVSTR